MEVMEAPDSSRFRSGTARSESECEAFASAALVERRPANQIIKDRRLSCR